MTDYDRTIHDSPDASRWAKFFMETLEENSWTMDDIDEGLMIGWFANAMEAMHSHHSPVYLQGTVPGLVSDALRFAQEAHSGQVRKYTGEPYVYHPMDVHDILCLHYPASAAMRAAAILHDVVEDTEVTLQDIEGRFGIKVAMLVDDLTDVSIPSDGNRAKRKEIDRQHTARASVSAQVIKCADIISNGKSIMEHDVKFAKTYISECLATLVSMKDETKGMKIWHVAFDLLKSQGV